jgi:hypothetical protein
MSSYFDSNLQSFIFMPGESVVAIGTCQQWGSKTQNVPPLEHGSDFPLGPMIQSAIRKSAQIVL